MKRGAAIPEAEITRRRDAEVNDLMQRSVEERSAMAKKSHFGFSITPDEGTYVTQAIQQVREKTQARQKRKGF